ncbi:MAG: hypothetical protein FWD48_04455 [Oscillospiraceae bacterium]|nr:hypothetical protein [Oscillospiraceae bacterium]
MFMNATDVRNEWSSVIDSVVREKPMFIKRTRDHMMLCNFEVIENILETYEFNAVEYIEDDGSVTLSLDEIDLVDNGKTKQEALLNLAKYILTYAEHYYEDFEYWYSAPNCRLHLPYVIKALSLNDVEKIGRLIKCRPGEI